jgi:hypothetical protein
MRLNSGMSASRRPQSRALTVFVEALDKAIAALRAARPHIIKPIAT